MDRQKKYKFIQEWLKRAGDILIAAVMLLLLSPLMLAVAILIRAGDHAPAIFTQQRLTKDGRIFTLYKFRSMEPGTEEDYSLTLAQDPRVTPIGRFIRKYRIDELPQLVNVLRGEMSMVGPRPERCHIAARIEEGLPEFALRLQVKAGLTGYAQVKGEYGTPSEEKLMLDLYYIEHFSLWLDLKILIQTISVVLRPEKAKGLEIDAEEYFSHRSS